MNKLPRFLAIIAVVLLSLFISIEALKATLPQTVIGNWTAANSLSQARTNAASVMLADGRILFIGGDSGAGPLQSVEVFGTDGTVSTAAAMNVPRSRHFAVALTDGRVLVGGGMSTGGGATNSAEIYDPSTDSWTATNPLTQARAGASAALLKDGRVVIAGGDNNGAPSNTVETYDPSTGNFTFAATLSSPRTQQAMAVLQDGRVLIVGGFDGTNPLASSDIFDPSTGAISAGTNLSVARYAHSATTLLNGQVAVIGGVGSDGNGGTTDLASIEIFDPSAGVFTTSAASLATARHGHEAFLLPNNNSVLIAGGSSAGQAVASSELLQPHVSSADGSWSYSAATTGSNVSARTSATGVAMQQDGLLLLGGGADASGNALASTELYAFPTVKTDQSDYAPGTIVTITGSGWKPGETVTLSLVESPLIDTHPTLTAVADGNGNISNNQFSPDVHDVNVRFYLTATGSQSGLQAQNTFTDASKDTWNATPNNYAIALNPGQAIPTSGPSQPNFTYTVTQGTSTKSSDHVTFNVNAGMSVTGAAWASPSKASITIPSYTSGDSAAIIGTVPCNQAAGLVTLHLIATLTNNTSVLSPNSMSNSVNITVTGTPDPSCAVNTTTSVASSLNPSTYGSSVTFTATVTANSGSSTPTGNVQFVIDNSNFGSPVALSGGVATLSTSTLTVNGGGAHTITANYLHTGNFVDSSGTLPNGQTVTAKTLTVSGITANNKVYDGTNAATLNTGSVALVGVVSGDTVTLNTGGASGSFSDRNVGTGKTVTVSGLTISGASAANYTVTQPTTTADITPKALTYSGISVPASKIYDGTTSAVVTGTAALQGAEAAGSGTTSDGAPYTVDSVSLTGTATGSYNSKDVATANLVTFAGLLVTGTGSGNYTLTALTQAATITQKALTYSGLSAAATKVYDGTTSAVVSGTATLKTAETAGSGSTSDGAPYTVDSVSLTGTATGSYNSKDVATANLVTFAGLSLTGTGNGNYTLTALTQAATITPKTATYGGLSVPVTKPYDGTNTAVVSGTAALQSAEAPGTGSTADGKPYTGDTVSVTGTPTATYNSANVSAANIVTFAGVTLSGSDSGNYTLTALTQPATITPATLIYNANPATRTYGAPDPASSGTVTGFVNSESQSTATTGTLTFTTTADIHSNVGTYPINGSGLTANYGNYVFVQAPANATAFTITKAHLNVKADDQSKPYDGMVFSAFTATLSGFVNSETEAGLRASAALSGSAGFAGPATTAVNAGTYTITPTAGTLTATNYDFTIFQDGTLQISKVHLTVKADDEVKTFDGSAFTNFTVSFTGFVNSENSSVVSGAAAFSGTAVGAVNAGTYTITPALGALTATNYDFTTFLPGTLTINPADTATAVNSSQNPSTFGQSVTFTAVVTNSSGTGVTPTGSVQFVVDGTNFGAPVVLVAGTATSGAISTLSVNGSPHTVAAHYVNADGNFKASTNSLVGGQVVTKASTTSSVFSSQNPSVFGQAVSFTATVTNSSGTGVTPTGSVQFVIDGVSFGSPVALVAGSATSDPASTLSVAGSPHSVAANYVNSDGNFANSNGSLSGGQTVNKADTQTAITMETPDPSVVGQPVTISYTVSVKAPGSGTPTGNVTVSDGTVSCTGTVAAGSCSVTFTSAGAKTITASYAGDSSFNSSVSPTQPHTVNKADTTTTIVNDSPNPSVVGQPVTVGYTVVVNAPGSGTPTGSVTVSDGVTSCTGSVLSGSCMLTFTTAGSRNLTATYAGDTNFNSSASAAEQHTVNKADTNTMVASSVNPSVFGQPITFTASVSVVAPGSGLPTGTVTFKDGATTLGTSPLSGNQAMLSTAALSVTTHSITAVYNGDGNFKSSTASALSQEVDKANTTTSITSETPDPSLLGQAVTVNFSVVAKAPGGGTPTGNVTVSDGTVSCTATVAAGSCSLTFTSVGTKTLTATYSGDGNFNSSSATASHTVQYNVCLLYDPTRAVKSGATYPLKMYLCDATNNDVSSSAIVVHAVQIFMSTVFTGAPEDAGNANPDSDFRFDPTLGTLGGYIFNLQTKGLSGGTYGFTFTAGADPTTHTVSPGFGVK